MDRRVLRLFTLVFAVLLCSGLVSILAKAQSPVSSAGDINLLQNPGFETGVFDPWQHDTITGYCYVQSPGHASNYDVYLSGEGAAWVFQDINPPRCAEYLEFWYKGPLGGSIRVGYSDATSYDQGLLQTDTWQLVHITLYTNKLVNNVRVWLGGGYGLEVDDFFLKAYDAVETIFGEDFEGTFPLPNWNYPYDSNISNGSDYWGDTFLRSHGGSYSAWCADIGTQAVGSTIWSDDFERASIGPNWFATDWEGQNGQDYWDNTGYRSHGGSYSAWCAQVGTQLAGFDYVANYDVHKYDDYMEAAAGRSVILDSTQSFYDLGYDSATLSYSYWLDCGSDGADGLQVRCYSNVEGGPLPVITHYGNSGGWKTETVSLPIIANSVCFYFYSNSQDRSEGAYVDDVVLTGYKEVPNRSVGQYDDNMEAAMYRQVNLNSYSSVTLSYWYWTETEYGYDYLEVMFTNASGWFFLDLHQGNSNGWQYSEVTIPTTAWYVGFYFRSDSTVHNHEGAYVDDVTLVGTEKTQATIESCDQAGTQKDSFDITDTIYTSGSGYTPLAAYNVYVVSDTSWIDGMSIPQRVPGTILSITLDSSGSFSSAPAWFSPLAPGRYDIIVDVNNNTKFDPAIDALDDNDVDGTAGFIVTEQETRQLSISVFGLGSTDPAIGAHSYSNGTEAPVQAYPTAGWRLDHWVLDGFNIEPMNPIPVTMSKDRNLMAVFVGAPPSIESSDRAGARVDQFSLTDDVYVTGTAYSPLIYYDVYVVGDVEWSDGIIIPERVPGTIVSVLSDLNGNLPLALVWSRPLTEGRYDICIDVNANGKYDMGIDALDNNDIEVTAGFVIPEFSLIILALFAVSTLVAAMAYTRKYPLLSFVSRTRAKKDRAKCASSSKTNR